MDGAWLYGQLKHWRNPGFSSLIQTYLEELGEGSADKNHVALYRQLLVRRGYVLGNAGTDTTDVIRGFDIEREVLRLFTQKSTAGRSAHSDHCRIDGRSVNEWLSQPADIPDFLAALKNAGWIQPGRAAEESRFWGLLQGDHAEMFGVVSAYEFQVIHDWIRGAASCDRQPYLEVYSTDGTARRPSYRAAARLAAARGVLPSWSVPDAVGELLDPDL